VAAAAQWPNLAGQHESYLMEALMQYKNGSRADMLMGPLVAPLDETTIEELAAFFAILFFFKST
jgi:cytochrome c553